jgi:tetratricopeptide (TPR) repeat protein
VDWGEYAEREETRYRDGEARLPEAADDDARQRQLTRMGNAAAGVGLAHLMAGESDEAREWFDRAVERYRESFPLAPPGSWGRPIAIVKARILSGDWAAAEEESRWTLEQGAAQADSPIGRYAACLALLVLGRDEEARVLADGLRTSADFPAEVGDALAMLAAEDPVGYIEAIEAVLKSFETRDEYLEDLPVADTVMVLQGLAARRNMTARLSSPLLPA